MATNPNSILKLLFKGLKILFIIRLIRTNSNNNNTNNNNVNDNDNDNNNNNRPGKRNDKLWKVKTRIVPIATGALGTIPKVLVRHLESTGVNLDVVQIQKTASLGTAQNLRRVLDY